MTQSCAACLARGYPFHEARYFAGLVIWAPGELDAEVRSRAWSVQPADAILVFSSNPPTLWKERSSRGLLDRAGIFDVARSASGNVRDNVDVLDRTVRKLQP
jgi:putative AlgH/UPF0301 family transcriptional regulator